MVPSADMPTYTIILTDLIVLACCIADFVGLAPFLRGRG
jgi:hypothetical protein